MKTVTLLPAMSWLSDWFGCLGTIWSYWRSVSSSSLHSREEQNAYKIILKLYLSYFIHSIECTLCTYLHYFLTREKFFKSSLKWRATLNVADIWLTRRREKFCINELRSQECLLYNFPAGPCQCSEGVSEYWQEINCLQFYLVHTESLVQPALQLGDK